MEVIKAVKEVAEDFILEIKRLFTIKKIALILLGTAILSFGIYNIHQPADITEGGVLGLILFINHWFKIPPSIISPILDIICYIVAFRFLGKDFIKISILATFSLSGFFRLWERFPPTLPNLENFPLVAAILGGVFVGVGVGIVVRQGGSSGGDDALALAIATKTKMRISKAYLATDISVLLLSLSYISYKKIFFSLVTVTISSYLIDFIEGLNKVKKTSKQSLSKQRF